MKPDLTPTAISARIAQASAASDLAPAHRLDSKLDMSPAGVSRRLNEVSQLLDFCRRLKAQR